MSQQDAFGPGTGPVSSPAPPPYGRSGYEQQPRYDQPYGQPGWEQPGQGPYGYPAAGSPPPGYDYGHDLGPQRTNVMAILGLVFAFVCSPLGIVFSATGLHQIGKRGERGRGLALTGLILSILFAVIGVLFAVLVLTSPTFKAALDSAESSASSAAADASSASSSAESSVADGAATDAGSAAGAGGAGVASACRTIIPALMNLEADMQDVTTPAQYQQAMSTLETTLSAAASGAQDRTFQQDIAKLTADLAQASATVAAGKDPSSLESALNADGEAVGEACATAGVTN